jgi:hypothetical protein
MIERCGDRQRKFDGLEKWPFRFCMESLPIMLQIALLLLTCGLSRYVWSINTSVGRVVLSFTVLGVLFYIAVVVAGTSSYECPFQTPASIGLRHLRDSKTARRLSARLFPQGSSRSPTPFGRLPSGCLFRPFAVRPRRSDTKSSSPFSGSIELSGTQNRDCPKGSKYSGVRDYPRPLPRRRPSAASHQVWHSQGGHEGRAPNHHSTSPGRSSRRERKAETGPRVQACAATPNHHRGRATSAACTSKRSRAAGACPEPGSPSGTKRG